VARRYAVLDVFTDRPFAGNPLAVVLDAAGLDDAQMQAIAREFNLSETVFVSPSENPVYGARLRIFTPARELPFAGHPTIGTAVLLGLGTRGENHNKHEMMMVLEEKIGPVRCGVVLKGAGAGHAVFDVPRQSTEAGEAPNAEAIAAAIGVAPAEIGFENHRPSVFSSGVAFHFVPVRDLSVIGRSRPAAAWSAAFGEAGGAFLYCRETSGQGRHFHARMFAPGFGIAEDPATGSAASAFAGVVKRFDELPAGQHRFVIEQGFEMGRPSLIGLEIDIVDGALSASRVGGDAVVVAEGTLTV
jgi:trans-2,3-dihydro-3-hydroxyanthranilate isomerase